MASSFVVASAGALLFLAGNLNCISPNVVEVCNGDLDTKLRCPRDHIIMMTSAEYGRKEVGRCIPEADEFMGCTNDVLPLLDRWCSGQRECTIGVPNAELESLNESCLKILIKYLKVEYTCWKVTTSCSENRPNRLTANTGLISSHSRDVKGCGSSHSPWIISASPGQTIHILMVDFLAKPDNSPPIGCPVVYGRIQETALGINYTICGKQDRKSELYTSKTNSVEIYVNSRSSRDEGNFILQYSVSGCPELKAPAHAWYKREGNKALIGCESSDVEWQLTCNGNTWSGDIGNCTEKGDVINIIREHDVKGNTNSVIIMTGIACGAVVLCVVAIVIGTVYIKKYRLRQETKHLTKTYANLERTSPMYCMHTNDRLGMIDPELLTIDKARRGSRDISHDPMNSYPGQCMCATLPLNGSNIEAGQSVYNSISST